MDTEVKTNVIKRNGEEVDFDLTKIANAIKAANDSVDPLHQMNAYQIQAVADKIAAQVKQTPHAVHVEDIQDMVETGIMEMRGYEVAQKYVRYRYKRELNRKSNTTDNGILTLIENLNEEINQEIINSLKNAGLKMEMDCDGNAAGSLLSGKTIVISGTFSHHSRDEYKEIIEANGGRNSGSISKKTSFVLAGENMGPSKKEKCEKLGIPLINESDFLKMIDGNGL